MMMMMMMMMMTLSGRNMLLLGKDFSLQLACNYAWRCCHLIDIGKIKGGCHSSKYFRSNLPRTSSWLKIASWLPLKHS